METAEERKARSIYLYTSLFEFSLIIYIVLCIIKYIYPEDINLYFINQPKCANKMCYHMFSHRIINWWNTLLEDVVKATNTTMFKKLFDTYNYDIIYSNNII